jgi:uncharacterized protein with HEPN domain
MDKKSLEKYLTDVLIYIQELEIVAVDITLNNINKSVNKWSVERALSIIGEALIKAKKINNDLPISNLKQIIGLRNILVHDYDKVDAPQLFIILRDNLPLLKQEVEIILSNKK